MVVLHFGDEARGRNEKGEEASVVENVSLRKKGPVTNIKHKEI